MDVEWFIVVNLLLTLANVLIARRTWYLVEYQRAIRSLLWILGRRMHQGVFQCTPFEITVIHEAKRLVER